MKRVGIALLASQLFLAPYALAQVAHVAPIHRAAKPEIDTQGRVQYIVDLVDDLQDRFPDQIDQTLAGRFAKWHQNRAKNMVRSFEVQYGLQATNMTSWVGN